MPDGTGLAHDGRLVDEPFGGNAYREPGKRLYERRGQAEQAGQQQFDLDAEEQECEAAHRDDEAERRAVSRHPGGCDVVASAPRPPHRGEDPGGCEGADEGLVFGVVGIGRRRQETRCHAAGDGRESLGDGVPHVGAQRVEQSEEKHRSGRRQRLPFRDERAPEEDEERQDH